jgi:hypothetical protein
MLIPTMKEVHHMTPTTTGTTTATTATTPSTELEPETVEELYTLWDRMRDAAISDRDRQEIDDIFARQLP